MNTGVSAEGEITKIEEMNQGKYDPWVRLYIHVRPKEGEEFDGVVKMQVPRVNIPRKGDIVTVWYDPKNRDDIIMY